MDDHEDSENRGCPPISLGKKENNMNTNFFRILIGTIAILSICRVNAEASEIIIKCKADLAFMSSEPVSIKIIKENQGMIQSEINGKISNKNVKVAEYPVRDNLDFNIDPYSKEYSTFNDAEISLVHIHMLAGENDPESLIKIPFSLSQVKKMKIYDLKGSRDKFGGMVLMEAFNKSNILLGRLFRALMVGPCI